MINDDVSCTLLLRYLLHGSRKFCGGKPAVKESVERIER
jgi:hypothetical protein